MVGIMCIVVVSFINVERQSKFVGVTGIASIERSAVRGNATPTVVEGTPENFIMSLLTTVIANESESVASEAMSRRGQKNQSSSNKGPCRILITNKIADHHHEVLESIALRFPLPWEKLKQECQDADEPIHIDFMLSFIRWVNEGKKTTQMEAWGWKTYFEQHLQGEIRNRSDGRQIKYGAIVGNTKRQVEALNLSQYAAQIEASCDKPIARKDSWKWLMEDQNEHYCVLHGLSDDMPLNLTNQTCQLNPMHSQQCWFIPSDYPEFPPPPPPYVNGTNLTVCIPTRMQKDPTPLIRALQKLKPPNLAVVLQGRRLKSKLDAFEAAKLSHYLVLQGDLKDYWTFQERISQCHVLVPLVEPSGESLMYFMKGNSTERKGQLTGFVSQMIGNRIPGVVHTELADIYRTELSAPVYEYNTTADGSSFTAAFKRMLDSFSSASDSSK